MMGLLLAVDLGGTKTLFELSTRQGGVVVQRHLESGAYAGFDDMLTSFLESVNITERTISAACIAVAGPVTGQTAKVTSLLWELDAAHLSAKFSIGKVLLCNDFEAVGHGIECLGSSDLKTLQRGARIDEAPRAVLGAGTGLGQALLIRSQSGWQVIPTEGGHVDFAPTDLQQVLLLEHLTSRYGHVSYDRIVCGKGLVNIYNFLRDYQQRAENPQLRLAMINGDPAAAISEYARQYHDKLASEALDMFMQIYGAHAGNLALASLARGGLYIAGGIAAKNLTKFEQPHFMDAFVDKGRMHSLMTQFPVHLVLQPQAGLLGARLLAQQSVV